MAALSWADSYTLSGILKLPYAEINEPFYAYFDGKKGMSRIDYYGGKAVMNIVWKIIKPRKSFA